MSWFEKLLPSKIRGNGDAKKGVPEGLWVPCSACQAVLYQPELLRHLKVCPKCGYHMRLGARERLQQFLDADSPTDEIGQDVTAWDILKFKDSKRYKDRLHEAEQATQEKEALVVLRGRLRSRALIAMAFDFGFIGGSMGSGVGERFVRGIHTAIEAQLPVVIFTASGGARMQEGLLSLFQMAKTAAALARLSAARLPYIVILTDPTFGGVSASLAFLGDIQLAEPGAVIGFAGPRVIQQAVRVTLPEGFQRADFLLAHGFVDAIVHRHDLQNTVHSLISQLMRVSG